MLLPQLPPIEDSRTVLVAEDEPDVRNLIAFKLTTAGFKVSTAANGRKALSMIERTPPDLMILDVAMPELSGIDVCRAVRSTVRTRALPVIMLTARTHVQQEHEGLMAGADLYLRKPFSPRELVAQVWDLLSYARD